MKTEHKENTESIIIKTTKELISQIQNVAHESDIIQILKDYNESIKYSSPVRNIKIYSNCDDSRLDYNKNYVFHHFLSKRKALIEAKETGELLEVHYKNFRFQ